MGATSPKLYDDPWAKPLLTVFSEDIEEFRRRFGVPFREDSTNLLTDYERNRLGLSSFRLVRITRLRCKKDSLFQLDIDVSV